MASYPYMVQTAYNVLAEVFALWRKQPYRWIRERDIQAEIGGRLNHIFTLQGLGTVTGDYGSVAEGFERVQSWSRVSYEPYVAFVWEGAPSRCHPDIVIWSDLAPNDPQPDYDEGFGWPILWACEIKYGSSDDGLYDVQKLDALMTQKKIEYGCAIRVHYGRPSKGADVQWNTSSQGHRFWICDIYAPMPKEDG